MTRHHHPHHRRPRPSPIGNDRTPPALMPCDGLVLVSCASDATSTLTTHHTATTATYAWSPVSIDALLYRGNSANGNYGFVPLLFAGHIVFAGHIRDATVRERGSACSPVPQISTGTNPCYALADANFNVTGIEMNGTVQERFAYSAYGTRSILNASWNATTDTKNWLVAGRGCAGMPPSGCTTPATAGTARR